MRLQLLAALLGSIGLVRGTAMADTAPGADDSAEVLKYDPPILKAQFLPSGAGGKATSRSVLDILLNRRQTCSAGYGYCAGIGCCPASNRCCSYGYCLPPASTCCPNGPCGSGKTCCGYNHCHPVGTQCCRDESYCEVGNICVTFPGIVDNVCCTDTRCTAYMTGGTTVTRTTSTTRTATRAVYTYYYFYVTWTYYVYYWYYSIEIRASVVTSSLTTTTSTVSIRGTNSADASSSFDLISATVSHFTPASATSLSSLAGSTSFLDGGLGGSSSARGGGGGGFTFSAPTLTGAGGGVGGGGSASSASRSAGPWADYLGMAFFTASALVAILMVVL